MSMDSYFAFLQGYVQEREQMAGQEREKYAALVSYDHQRIDRAVSAQQAANVRSNHRNDRNHGIFKRMAPDHRLLL